MTTPQDDPFDDAPEADVAEQRVPVDPGDAADDGTPDGSWRDADRVAGDRDWQASEADLIEQTIDVPIDDDFDR
ncbi:hypothetical protein FK535_13765 [Mycolicibacterium sp. 018/SC-01/001]|uniref:hypothetical protein n=1 Tax=Mycolicibacterium sp. 018/SC-01/001 TaxID=2592069 RepID=UPI00117F194C|nr:hypothetical protein [Mycolicibacterium sp. 018/SC-01/001]TRW82447.1 hypothetical protein FK535_13765 [Mycolicibacterium sp. 018/SC-01/001]